MMSSDSVAEERKRNKHWAFLCLRAACFISVRCFEWDDTMEACQ